MIRGRKKPSSLYSFDTDIMAELASDKALQGVEKICQKSKIRSGAVFVTSQGKYADPLNI